MTTRPGIDLAEWYPLLVAADIPTPATAIVRTELDLTMLIDGEEPEGFAAFLAELGAAAEHLGYPIFLRTGYGSGKHEWVDTCLVPSAADLGQHVFALVEWSNIVDLFGLPTNTWVVRELLPTQAAFTAFVGMPITKERRYFIRDGEILGFTPYWPPDTISSPSVPDWRARLDAINEMPPEEVAELSALALRVSAVVPGAWSVDFLWVPERGWLAIDMAHAEASFCWTEHPNAPHDLGA
jgi:hypothetical protein